MIENIAIIGLDYLAQLKHRAETGMEAKGCLSSLFSGGLHADSHLLCHML